MTLLPLGPIAIFVACCCEYSTAQKQSKKNGGSIILSPTLITVLSYTNTAAAVAGLQMSKLLQAQESEEA